jgi:hypothetical protein
MNSCTSFTVSAKALSVPARVGSGNPKKEMAWPSALSNWRSPQGLVQLDERMDGYQQYRAHPMQGMRQGSLSFGRIEQSHHASPFGWSREDARLRVRAT